MNQNVIFLSVLNMAFFNNFNDQKEKNARIHITSIYY